MTKDLYWKDGQLVEQTPEIPYVLHRLGLTDCPCVDQMASSRSMRSGMWKYCPGKHQFDWIHIPVEQLPKEFRTSLLLLGINP